MPSSVDCQATRDSNPKSNDQGPIRSDDTRTANSHRTTGPLVTATVVSNGTHFGVLG
jgi:hypothetical protein